MTVGSGAGSPVRQQSIRAMNEQLLLELIRRSGSLSRADLARITSLSKPTVSGALANLERGGLVRAAGVRTGVAGPAAVLYEVDPEAGFVLALDVGGHYLRGAIGDLSGAVRARDTLRTRAVNASGRIAGLGQLAENLCGGVGIAVSELSQIVLGSPGVFDPRRDALQLTGGLPGWDRPMVLDELRLAFGDTLMIENDVDAAALAERALGHGRDVDSFAFVSIGTGIGMGLVLGGRLHRGAHGAAGEIGYLPLDGGPEADPREAVRRGTLEASASATAIVRSARPLGMRGPVSARSVFAAAAKGDPLAAEVVADEARLVARAVCSVIAVVDPELVVLGGGVGQADGFLAAVAADLRKIAPVLPELRVSALGVDAVVDGCLAAGLDRAWEAVTSADGFPDVVESRSRRRVPA